MIDFLQAVIAFIFALGVLITFHEFGHYWVAKKCGVKILRFSIGFGRPIYRRLFGPDQTEFVIASLPLGGYVKMLDEREGQVQPEEMDRAFNNKPLLQRMLVVVAGPAFNFIFAVLAYWLMYMAGISGLKPLVDVVDEGSPALQAGLQPGDEIISVEKQRTPTWTSVIEVIVASVIAGDQQVELLVKAERGSERYSRLELGQVTVDDMSAGNLLVTLGVTPKYPPVRVVIREVQDDSPAYRGGLRAGDQLLSADGEKIDNALVWVDHVKQRPEQSIRVEVLRDTHIVHIDLVPEVFESSTDELIGRVGTVVFDEIIEPEKFRATQTYPAGGAVIKALDKTLEMSVMTLRILGKMIVGEASVKNLSGPISIAQYAGQSAGLGLAMFLGFLAIVSVSLGVLNLLPIPLLDGGHLFYYMIELIKGSPVSESVQAVGQQVGLAVLIGLMGIAFYNDIIRLVG